MAFVAAGTGFVVWLRGAGPAVRGPFEGQREWSFVYVELPCALVGFPLVTVLAWAWMRAALRGRAGRAMRNVVSGAVVVLALVVSGLSADAWLTHRVDGLERFNQEE